MNIKTVHLTSVMCAGEETRQPIVFKKVVSQCTVAVIKGDTDAPWLSAATLDRYLQSTQRKQIFGTQYDGDEKKGYTFEPYDDSLLTDSVRKAVQVPTREEQQKDLQSLNKHVSHNREASAN